jgi:hypothetical protein
MSMQPNTNLKPVELTPAELDSVAGGNPGIAAVLMAATATKFLRGSRPSIERAARPAMTVRRVI